MANPGDDVFFATVTELNTRLKQKEFSAVELTRAFSDRLEKLGPRYNALALSLRPSALRKARDVENLWVVDGGFFPSSAAMNPALTIAAQALRVVAESDLAG